MMLKGTSLKATAAIVADDPGHFRNGQHKTTGFSHSTPEDFKPASAMLSEASAAAGAGAADANAGAAGAATEDGYGIQAGRIFSNPTAIKH